MIQPLDTTQTRCTLNPPCLRQECTTFVNITVIPQPDHLRIGGTKPNEGCLAQQTDSKKMKQVVPISEYSEYALVRELKENIKSAASSEQRAASSEQK
jgi:hypothetical protein